MIPDQVREMTTNPIIQDKGYGRGAVFSEHIQLACYSFNVNVPLRYFLRYGQRGNGPVNV